MASADPSESGLDQAELETGGGYARDHVQTLHSPVSGGAMLRWLCLRSGPVIAASASVAIIDRHRQRLARLIRKVERGAVDRVRYLVAEHLILANRARHADDKEYPAFVHDIADTVAVAHLSGFQPTHKAGMTL